MSDAISPISGITPQQLIDLERQCKAQKMDAARVRQLAHEAELYLLTPARPPAPVNAIEGLNPTYFEAVKRECLPLRIEIETKKVMQKISGEFTKPG